MTLMDAIYDLIESEPEKKAQSKSVYLKMYNPDQYDLVEKESFKKIRKENDLKILKDKNLAIDKQVKYLKDLIIEKMEEQVEIEKQLKDLEEGVD